MIQHYLKIALRNMRRFKLQTLVCLTGLAVGMTCFALGTLWLRYIESFEDFVPDAENVYLASTKKEDSNGGTFYRSSYSTGDLLRARPEIKDVCSVSMPIPTWGRDAGGRDVEMAVMYGDSAFFRMFGIEAVEGSLAHLRPHEVVLTEEMARRLFGDMKVVGKMLTMGHAKGKAEEELDDRFRYTVAAVVRHLPPNTQFAFDAVTELPAHMQYMKEDIGIALANTFYTFARKHEAANVDSLTQKYNLLDVSSFRDDGSVSSTYATLLRLLPLRQLRTEFQQSATAIQTNYVRWFVMLGVLVIACALCNYLITMVTRLRIREREFALRRVNGASRLSIYLMLSVETLLLFLLSGALGWCLTWLVLPAFREYSGIELPLGNIALEVWLYLLAVTAVGLLSMLLTAAFVMRRSRNNILYTRQNSPSLRGRGLGGEALQLALAMAIVFASTVIMQQIRHISYSGEIGFNVNRTVLLNYTNEALRHKVLQSPMVAESLITPKAAFPSLDLQQYAFYADSLKAMENADGSQPLMVETADRSWAHVLPIDSAHVRFLGYQLLDGRLPLAGKTTVGEKVVQEACITESVARRFAMKNPVGRKLYTGDKKDFLIVGLVKDLYFSGATRQPDRFLLLHTEDVEPDVFVGSDTNPMEMGLDVYLRPAAGQEQALRDTLQAWYERYDNTSLGMIEIKDTDQLFQRYMASERLLLNVLWAVASASMFVCVIGAFSLISLSLQQRRKEIAIRKVHGARMRDILRLFLKGQVVSLCLAAVVAYPVAYIIMKHWLEGYAKQVAIDWWLIPLTFLGIAAVVLMTITAKIWRAAKEKTVEALNG